MGVLSLVRVNHQNIPRATRRNSKPSHVPDVVRRRVSSVAFRASAWWHGRWVESRSEATKCFCAGCPIGLSPPPGKKIKHGRNALGVRRRAASVVVSSWAPAVTKRIDTDPASFSNRVRLRRRASFLIADLLLLRRALLGWILERERERDVGGV